LNLVGLSKVRCIVEKVHVRIVGAMNICTQEEKTPE